MQIEEFYDLFNEKFKAIVLPIYFKILRMGFVEEIYDYKDVKREVQDTLIILEEKYLRDHPFLVDRSEPSICDLYLFTEFLSLNMIEFDMTSRPLIFKYINRVAKAFPLYQKANKVVLKIAKKRNKRFFVLSTNIKL